MKNIIVVHDRYSNEPIIIRIAAINSIKKCVDRGAEPHEEYSEMMVDSMGISVKETIGKVMEKIKKAEREDKE